MRAGDHQGCNSPQGINVDEPICGGAWTHSAVVVTEKRVFYESFPFSTALRLPFNTDLAIGAEKFLGCPAKFCENQSCAC